MGKWKSEKQLSSKIDLLSQMENSQSYRSDSGSLHNGFSTADNSQSASPDAEGVYRSYRIPLASDASSGSRMQSGASTPSLASLTSSYDDQLNVKRVILKRRETSFFRREAKPVVKNEEVHVELKAVSVSPTQNSHENGDNRTYSFSGEPIRFYLNEISVSFT